MYCAVKIKVLAQYFQRYLVHKLKCDGEEKNGQAKEKKICFFRIFFLSESTMFVFIFNLLFYWHDYLLTCLYFKAETFILEAQVN